ncbi:MAG: translation elongation factor Ts [Gemmatimonadota bacterium]|nr:translation elongation factor Ts [Gemmatimonadota bacterium]
MSGITAQAVKSLRDRTGAGMMDCKKALSEAGGDEEKAIDLLRQWGSAKAAKRAGRDTTEGSVQIVESGDATAMVAVASETDFVARNADFQEFARRLAEAVAASDLDSGRPVDGETLLARPAFAPFANEVADLRSRIGENIQVHRAVRFAAAPDRALGSYLHFDGKRGVVVELEGAEGDDARAVAGQVAMHVAATRPAGVTPEDIPADVRDRERAVLAEQTKAEGKPEAIVERIVEGRMRKFFEQQALLLQPFVREPDVTVGELLGRHGEAVTVRGFARFEIGE